MLKVLVMLQIAALHLAERARKISPNRRRSERGSVTTEHVLWAVAVIAIVGIVVAAITSYVTKQSGNLK
jgi:heme/copper-type cytochrome/quinol oxidase subunit 2